MPFMKKPVKWKGDVATDRKITGAQAWRSVDGAEGAEMC